MDKNKLDIIAALNHTAISTDTNTDGIVIDTKGARDVNFGIQCHGFTDGTYTIQVLEDDVVGMGSASVIAAADINGDQYNTAITPASDDVVHVSINRTSHKQFVQLRVVSASTTSGAELSAVCVLGSLQKSKPSADNPS